MDLAGMKILGVVTAKSGENPDRLKGKGFSAMFVSRELAGPNPQPSGFAGKGKHVNSRVPWVHLSGGLTLWDIPGTTVVVLNACSVLEFRKGEKARNGGVGAARRSG